MARVEGPKITNILGSCFVLSVKNKDTNKEIYKARYIDQEHRDLKNHTPVHTSRNLNPSSLHLLLSFPALFWFNVCTQDVPQAYFEYTEKLMRDIYVQTKAEINLSKNVCLKLLKPFMVCLAVSIIGIQLSPFFWATLFT